MSENSTTAFGSAFAEKMSIARYDGDRWQPWELVATGPLPIHPAIHALHYGSTCFEGLKSYRWENGEVRLFRLDRHVARMRTSAELLCLPVPEEKQLTDMINAAVRHNADSIPDLPGALYLRPMLIGTDENIGKASAPTSSAILAVLASPVGDYFSGGLRPLKVMLDEKNMRSTPQFGQAKCGANYVQALGIIEQAKARHGADQVLFCPDDDAQETGAANFVLIDDKRIITRHLDSSYLHGVTRDSVLAIGRDLGYEIEERAVSISEMKEFIKTGEMALTGTAAVLTPVGTLVHNDEEFSVGDGGIGKNSLKLREALVDLQSGRREDTHGWITHA